MIYTIFRQTVSDYEKWRLVFDEGEAYRKTSGATGVSQVYRDVDDPNTITVVTEWDSAESIRKYMDDPVLRESLQKAGVIGTPTVRAITSRA
jgi:heme-degrading monooxygenase HmoA